MKVNLMMGPALARKGYLNICPMAEQETEWPKLVISNAIDLTEYVDQGECEELVANWVLSRVPFHDIPPVVKHWQSCVAKGGKLIITDTNLMALVHNIVSDAIEDDEANKLLYGTSHEIKSCVSMDAVLGLFSPFTILKKELDGLNYTLVGQKP